MRKKPVLIFFFSTLTDVSFVLRKAGAHATTYIEISREGADGIRWQYKIAFKSGDLHFKLGQEFDETTPDGRPVKVWSFHPAAVEEGWGWGGGVVVAGSGGHTSTGKF